MVAIQLEFFKTEHECEMDAIRADLQKVIKSNDKVRKSHHATKNSFGNELVEIKMRLEILERGICKGLIYT